MSYHEFPDSKNRWSSMDEIDFLNRLYARNPGGCLDYCELICSDGRVWDSSVDVAQVKNFASRLLAEKAA